VIRKAAGIVGFEKAQQRSFLPVALKPPVKERKPLSMGDFLW
jgi:hypothetical protein